MVLFVILAGFLTAGGNATRVLDKSTERQSQAVVHESDFLPGQLLPGARSASNPTMTAGISWNASLQGGDGRWRSLHGGADRRVPWVSMQELDTQSASDRWVGRWRDRGNRGDPETADARDTKAQKNKKKMVLMPGGVGLKSGAAVLPRPDKADRKYKLFPYCGGEDAYFVDDRAGVVGVADGVGGSASSTVDPGMYSRELMNFAAEEVGADGIFRLQDDPGKILQRAHNRTFREQAGLSGSTTALILGFSREEAAGMSEATWKVKVANLGDSGFVHLRSGKVLFQSTPLQHGKDHPFQLSADCFSDSPTDAQNYEIRDVLKGDVFVLGTDGLFDNAFSKEIAGIVRREELKAVRAAQRSLDGSVSFAETAAYEVALWAAQGVEPNPDRITPWAVMREMSYDPPRKFKHRYPGGKTDDITAVVVVVGGEGKPKVTSEASADSYELIDELLNEGTAQLAEGIFKSSLKAQLAEVIAGIASEESEIQ